MKSLEPKTIGRGLNALGIFAPKFAGKLALNLFCTPKHYDRPEWEKRIIAQGERRTFANGLAGTIWGRESDPVVLLIHGWAGRGSQLSLLVEPLLKDGFRVVALDGPAHGDSPGKKTNLNFFSIAMSEVIAELSHVHAIVAHSFGAGATALALSRGAAVERVVLVASPSTMSWVISDFCRILGLSTKVGSAFHLQLEAWSGVKAVDVDIAVLARRIRAPALIVHDPEDRDVPFQNAKSLAENWPGSRILTIEKVGHRKILKDKTFIEATRQFLCESATTARALHSQT
jgi:pimeloyl-ACP methyl ester carboxylesterase